MGRSKIAFLIFSLGSGGAERVVSGLANNLADTHDVTIITLVKKIPFYQLNSKVQLLHCSDKIKTATNPLSSLYDGVVRVITIYKFLRKHEIQLLINFMTMANIYGILASKLAKIPCIISERANHAVYQLPKLIVKIRNLIYKHANLLVVQTEGNKDFYENVISPDKILIIQNPISETLQSKRSLHRKEGKKNYILNVGSFKQGKAQDLLISAFANIPNEGWELIFVGEGPKKSRFLQLAHDLKIADKTSFEGQQSDIHTYYKNATIFVFTSEHEGFPNALMEALFFGIPSISTDCPYGPSDLITDGENGFLIPVGNRKKLEKQMMKLMGDVDLQHQFSEKAILSTKKFEMELIAGQWKQQINKLL